ncbi:MAG: hypothetical protein WCH86_02295 [Kiritimatiellales bacterium]
MPTMQTDLFDPCKRKHGGNAQSVAANRKNLQHRAAQRKAVFDAISAAGGDGLTCRELAERMNVGMNCISGRFSELKAAGWIKKVNVRTGCGVFVKG